jgi:hypothetical protein
MKLWPIVIAILMLLGINSLLFTVRAADLSQQDIINLDTLLINGDEMFSLRQLAEKLALNLTYLPCEKDVLIFKGSQRVLLDLDEGEINNKILKKHPIIYQGRTYLTSEGIALLLQSLLPEQSIKLLTSIYINIEDEKRMAVIRAYNISGEKLTLYFNSGQSYDLYLFRDNDEIWRWSEGKFFTMAIVSREIEPGEKLSYEVEIPVSGLEVGQYILTGELTTIKPLQLGKIKIVVDKK